MKNVTVTMEDSVADWARMEAARRNTSVSRLVGEMLAEKMRHDDAYERAMNEWLQRDLSFKSDGSAYPKRDDTYAERLDRLR
jgi:hypothetical protein